MPKSPIDFLKTVPPNGILKKYWHLFPHNARGGVLPINDECNAFRIKSVRVRCCRAHHNIYILPSGRLFLSAHQDDKIERDVMSAILMLGQAPEKERLTRCERVEKAWNRFLRNGDKSLLKDMPKEMRDPARAFCGLEDRRSDYARQHPVSAYTPEESWRNRKSKYVAILQDELRHATNVWGLGAFFRENFSELYQDGFFYTTCPALRGDSQGITSRRVVINAQSPFEEKDSDVRTVLFTAGSDNRNVPLTWGRAQRKTILIQDHPDVYQRINRTFAETWGGPEYCRTAKAVRRRFQPGIMREVTGWEIFEIGGA